MARRKVLKGGSAPAAETQALRRRRRRWSVCSVCCDRRLLLGDHLPESIVNDFIASEDFAIYQEVAQSPDTADETRAPHYYRMVDDQLGNMSPRVHFCIC